MPAERVQPTRRPPILKVEPTSWSWQTRGWWVSMQAFAKRFYEVPDDFTADQLLPVDAGPRSWRSA